MSREAAPKIATERMKKYYDRGTAELSTLKPETAVRVQPTRLGVKEWIPGLIVRRVQTRSYLILAGNSLLQRNRKHIAEMSN